MDAGIIAALITSVASVVVSVGASVWTRRQGVELERMRFESERSARDHEKRSAAKAELDRYREPLLLAVVDLGARLHTIRERGLQGYLGSTQRRGRLAVLGTVYCVARYLGTLEILYSRLALLRFDSATDTRLVAALLADIGRAFSSQLYDEDPPSGAQEGGPPAGASSLRKAERAGEPRFMLWREEQRAIGELMRGPDGTGTVCVGFACFHDSYDELFASWLDPFAEALRSPSAPDSERLARLQTLLALLVTQLDEDGGYSLTVDGTTVAPEWATPAALAP
ncbi:hypothetical protein MXD59_23840 [Frankia sp. Ag45/Mut15]|uniref:Secreted protein n=1 Tax=Frankia umida TaxID=573489 RepID=A0ABT0K4M8_9ACTN|nr:hypothetical protein [Frankia umida]MCK9878756.1 hypothetical protein [Frankia umida]